MKPFLGPVALCVLLAACGGGGDNVATSDRSTTTSDRSTTTTTRVDFSGADSDAYCAANVRLNQELVAGVPTSDDPAAFEAFFDQRVAAIRELESVAPAEISADVAVAAGAFDAFRPLLAAAGWDESLISEAEAAAIQTPEIAVAEQRLAQYDEQVCGISTQG